MELNLDKSISFYGEHFAVWTSSLVNNLVEMNTDMIINNVT